MTVTAHRARRPRAARAPLVLGLAVAFGLLALPPTGIRAATKTIEILAAAFQPKTITVSAGTTLIFKNISTFPHTATADDGTFDTGMIAAGASKSVTLTKPGSIPFHCQFHGGAGGVGQSGTIVVAAAAATPKATASAGGGSAPTPPNTAIDFEWSSWGPDLGIAGAFAAVLAAVLLAFGADAARRRHRARSRR